MVTHHDKEEFPKATLGIQYLLEIRDRKFLSQYLTLRGSEDGTRKITGEIPDIAQYLEFVI